MERSDIHNIERGKLTTLLELAIFLKMITFLSCWNWHLKVWQWRRKVFFELKVWSVLRQPHIEALAQMQRMSTLSLWILDAVSSLAGVAYITQLYSLQIASSLLVFGWEVTCAIMWYTVQFHEVQFQEHCLTIAYMSGQIIRRGLKCSIIAKQTGGFDARWGLFSYNNVLFDTWYWKWHKSTLVSRSSNRQ